MDNINCKTQAHTRVCKENKLEKNDAYWNNFAVKGKASVMEQYTVNMERFTGLNFCILHGFQEYRESFPINISTSL